MMIFNAFDLGPKDRFPESKCALITHCLDGSVGSVSRRRPMWIVRRQLADWHTLAVQKKSTPMVW
jgi:hypothetical protein